jgi:hypothetical protein
MMRKKLGDLETFDPVAHSALHVNGAVFDSSHNVVALTESHVDALMLFPRPSESPGELFPDGTGKFCPATPVYSISHLYAAV